MALLRKIRTWIWGAPAEAKVERRLIVKLDTVILSFCCLMYWVNYLDRANLNNAYVSGMKEDLNFHGKQLNVINTIFYGGYVLGQIPSNLALQKLPPRIFFPTCIVGWGLLTLGTAFTHHPWQIMIIRFFQALIEASTFVGCHYILGSWYTPTELGKRTAIFTSSGLAGTLFSGILQGAIYSIVHGKSGLAGWRWLFIINFLITIVVAIYGYLIFPDTPTSTKARYLNHEERQLAIERLPEVDKGRGEMGWNLFSRVLASWHWWCFVAVWTFASNTEMFTSNAVMNLWLSSTGDYSVEEVNYIPSAVSAVGIVATLLLGWYADITRKFWHVGVILSCTAIISGSIMLSPPTRGAKFFALLLNGAQFASQTSMFAWANNLTRTDDAKRGIVLASMNTVAIAVYMFWSLIFYNAEQAPMWREGSIAMICMGLALFFTTMSVRFMENRDHERNILAGVQPADVTDEEKVTTENFGAKSDML